jgi:hypothetical protein
VKGIGWYAQHQAAELTHTIRSVQHEAEIGASS